MLSIVSLRPVNWDEGIVTSSCANSVSVAPSRTNTSSIVVVMPGPSMPSASKHTSPLSSSTTLVKVSSYVTPAGIAPICDASWATIVHTPPVNLAT